MIFLGHIAASTLTSKASGTELRANLAASMFPDLIDKPVRWIFRLTPNDRIPAHTFLVWTLTSLIAYLLGGARFGRGWWVGYGSHLLCDELNAHLNPGRIYFWWPFRRYHMHTGPTGINSSLHDFSAASLLIEIAITLLAGGIWLGDHRQHESHIKGLSMQQATRGSTT